MVEFEDWRRQQEARRAACAEPDRAEIRRELMRNVALAQSGALPSEQEAHDAAMREHDRHYFELGRNGKTGLWLDIEAALRSQSQKAALIVAAPQRGEFDQLQARVCAGEARIGGLAAAQRALSLRVTWLAKWVFVGLAAAPQPGEFDQLQARVCASEARIGGLADEQRALSLRVTWLTKWVFAGLAMARSFAARLQSRGHSRPAVDKVIAQLESELASGRTTMAEINKENRTALADRLGTYERMVYRALPIVRAKWG